MTFVSIFSLTMLDRRIIQSVFNGEYVAMDYVMIIVDRSEFLDCKNI